MTLIKRKKIVPPNFLIGGTAAGGTSFLAATLIQHPQIYLPKDMRPEPHFFYKSWEYKKGIEYYLEKWFSSVPKECIAIGERSSSYLFGGRDVAKKIAAAFPNIKFIFTLRNPIERTWANYRFTVLQGLEALSFEDALEQEEYRIKNQSGIWAEIQPYNYTGRGFYGSQLLQFLEFFPIEQILLIKSENLSKQTDEELMRIYSYLGLTELNFVAHRPTDHTSVNIIDPALQMDLRSYFSDRFDKVIEATRKEEKLMPFIGSDEDRQAIEKLQRNIKGKKEDMTQKDRAYLRNLFSEDMKTLKSIVNFDITDWK